MSYAYERLKAEIVDLDGCISNDDIALMHVLLEQLKQDRDEARADVDVLRKHVESLEMFNENLQNEVARLRPCMEELKYLKHFYANADFGPADHEVRMLIRDYYRGEVPEGYRGDE